MKKWMEERYSQAKRFDEGEIYKSREYSAIVRNQMELYEKLRALLGPAICPLLEEYTAAIGDEMELECRHFFEEGYRLGRKEHDAP